MTHGVLLHGGDDTGLEARPEEELAHEEALHDALDVTEAGRERQRAVAERLDEALLKRCRHERVRMASLLLNAQHT